MAKTKPPDCITMGSGLRLQFNRLGKSNKSETQGARINFRQYEELAHVLCSFQQRKCPTSGSTRPPGKTGRAGQPYGVGKKDKLTEEGEDYGIF